MDLRYMSGSLFTREMEISAIRNIFARYSPKKAIDRCEELTGVIFMKFARKFLNQKLNELDLADEEKYNLENWVMDFQQNKIIWKEKEPESNSDSENK